MAVPNKSASLPEKEGSDTLLDNVLTEHDRAVAAHQSATAVEMVTQSLPSELQKVVQLLCETYEAIDLRIETTLGAAETDFLLAMPELKGYEAELRQLVAVLIADLRNTVEGKSGQPLLLRFAYQDKGDLVEQLLSGAKARLVVVPINEDASLHANIEGSRK